MDVDVAAWLRGLGFERYVQAFHDNAVGAEILRKRCAEPTFRSNG